ncbi:MAG: response regulator transcription factor [Dehalococcoidales bacterium]|nr:response regulator transcription factor [Dehalococcoidales bacterium]
MKILLIEDDPEIIEYISIAFEVGWSSITLITSHHGKKGIELVEKETPELVILDLGLPDISGYEVLEQIRLFSSVPVMIITVRDSEPYIVKGLERGANEYLVKPFGQLELIARVKTLLRLHHTQDNTSLITYGHLEFNPATGKLKHGLNSIFLTRTECLILQKLMAAAGRVITVEELAEAIWGCPYPNANDTLRVYIRRIRLKIEKELLLSDFVLSRPGVGYYLEKIPRP